MVETQAESNTGDDMTATITQQTADAIVARLLERMPLHVVEGVLAELDPNMRKNVVAAVMRHRSR